MTVRPPSRPAQVDDIHRAARAMPHVTVEGGDHPVYQVGGRSFVFFRGRRADAIDPETGERLDDVVVFWVADEDEKQAILAQGPPWFTTPHFDGHASVLVRLSQLHQLEVDELTEVVLGAWLARASRARARQWLTEHGLPPD